MAKYEVHVGWQSITRTTHTAATFEVDVMPHLARTPEGGPFDAYREALQNLGASYVRFSPWLVYPRVVVPELTQAVGCEGANWNSSLLDPVVDDFMVAVCGPAAAEGVCEHPVGYSVAPQLSTMPEWLFVPDGHNRTADFPADPWHWVAGHVEHYAASGRALVDSTCNQMAQCTYMPPSPRGPPTLAGLSRCI